MEIEDPFGKKDPHVDGRGAVRHAKKLTHFVNLESVIREIDATTSVSKSLRQLHLLHTQGQC